LVITSPVITRVQWPQRIRLLAKVISWARNTLPPKRVCTCCVENQQLRSK
jgi:hypothetical protein